MMIPKSFYDAMRPMPVFKPELRQANRDGLKSQTRRVIDPQPKIGLLQGALDAHWYDTDYECLGHVGKYVKCPYGYAGDYCYMREPLYHGFGGVAYYRDDLTMVRHALTGEPITWRWKKDILTSIFMPREAVRSVYRYEFIRVERLQDIEKDENINDVFEEGLPKSVYYEYVDDEVSDIDIASAVEDYKELWNSINEKRGYSFEMNPWVWVLGYKPVEVQGE